MNIEEKVRDALVAMSAVTAKVGTGSSARIYPDTFPETLKFANLPAICVQVDTADTSNYLGGAGSLTFAELTVICRDDKREDAHSLAEAVKWNGANPGTGLTSHSSTLTVETFDSEVPSYTPADDGSSRGYYDINLVFTISFAEQT